MMDDFHPPSYEQNLLSQRLACKISARGIRDVLQLGAPWSQEYFEPSIFGGKVAVSRALRGKWRRSKSRTVSGNSKQAYLYLLPTFVILGIFVFYPIIESFRLSLRKVGPFGGKSVNVGLENYTDLLSSSEYWGHVKVSVLFMLATVPVGIIVAVGLAIMLSVQLRRLSWLHRTLIFTPVVISSAIAGVIFRQLFHPVVGHINTGLGWVGIEGQDWLTSNTWALLSVSLVVVWRQLGFNVIIALAGLQNIDQNLYDAALIDGATTWQRIRYVTLPMLTPTLFFLSVVNVIFSFQAFGEINILTDGNHGTTNLVYSVYLDAFVGTSRRGFASAQAFLLAILVISFSIVQFKGLGKKVHYG